MKHGKCKPSAKILNANPELLSNIAKSLNSGLCYNSFGAPIAQRIEHRSSDLALSVPKSHFTFKLELMYRLVENRFERKVPTGDNPFYSVRLLFISYYNTSV